MIKKFNESWGALEDGNRNNSDKEYWKQYWNKMSRDINFEMDTIAEYAMKNSISYEDAQRYFKNKENTKFKIDDKVINKYTKEVSIVVDKEMKHGEMVYKIKDIDGELHWNLENALSLYTEPVKFKKGFEVIGLPSGQLIYMNLQQLNYFKARDKVNFKKTWKKPTAGGFYPINIESYTFEDKYYKDIIDMMDTITWN